MHTTALLPKFIDWKCSRIIFWELFIYLVRLSYCNIAASCNYDLWDVMWNPWGLDIDQPKPSYPFFFLLVLKNLWCSDRKKLIAWRSKSESIKPSSVYWYEVDYSKCSLVARFARQLWCQGVQTSNGISVPHQPPVWKAWGTSSRSSRH